MRAAVETFGAQEGQGYEVEMLSRAADGFGLWITEDRVRPALSR